MKYEQIIPQVVDEVKMSPNRIDQMIGSIEGVVAGFEAELCFTGALQNSNSNSSSGPDYDQDESIRSIRHIIGFFSNGNNSTIQLNSLEDQLNKEYLEWRKERVAENLKNIEKSIGPVGLIMAFKQYANNTHNTARTKIFNIDDIMVKLLVANNSGSRMSKEQAEEIVMNGDEHYMTGDYSDWDDTSGMDIYYYNEAAQEALEYIEERLQNPITALRIRDTAENLIATNNIINGFFKETIGDTDYKITQGAWLEYMDYNAMSDIEREYAIYWPYDSYDSDDDSGVYNGTDASRIGKSMGNTLGVQVEVSDDYHSITRENDLWIIEPDSSIQPYEGDDLAAEIISPPMPLDETLDKITQFFTWAKSEDAYSNETTGFHVGVSFPDIGGRVDYVKLALFLGDEYVLNLFDRESNRYCRSAVSKIKDTIGESDPATIGRVIDALKHNLNNIAERLPKMANSHGKYTSINMKGDYIEFRSMGNDYVNQVPQIIATIKRYVYAMYIASQPGLYTREYATKLYKVLGNSITDDASTNKFIELYSQFNAGKIDKETLITNMIPVHIARDQNKTNATAVYIWEFRLPWTDNIFHISASTKDEAVEYFKGIDKTKYRWDSHDEQIAARDARPIARSANAPGHIVSKLKNGN